MKLCLSIKTRLIIFALSISLIPMAIITVIHYLHAKNTLQQYILEKLRAVAQSKKMHILCFVETKKIRTADFSTDGFIRTKLDQCVRNGKYNQYAAIQLNKYLSTHKLPLSNNLKAIVIVDVNGKVISSTSEHLYGRDMSDNEVFIQGKSRSYGEIYTGQPHDNPYLNINCICVSAPVLSRRSSNLLGVIINMYSLTNLNEITRRNVGIGETGEIYLVNRNKKMITESKFIENASLKQVVDTEPVRRIFEHSEEMVGIYKDYRGVKVVGVSLEIPEYGWIMLAEIDYAEAFAPLKTFGKNPRIMKSGLTPPEVYKRMWDAITAGKEWKGELYNRKKDGVLYWENTSIMPMKNSAGENTHFLAIKEDITERKHFVEQLSSMANHDPLTGLFNRRRFLDTFEERLAQARRYGTNGALLFLDLDNFKGINATLGHQAGDEYLISFSRLLQERIRKTDILARFGGDEFAILLSHVDADKVRVISHQIIESARRQISVANKKPTGVTVSIGIALFPQHSCIQKTLLVYADLAMYRAKEEGRNRACMYTTGMDAKPAM